MITVRAPKTNEEIEQYYQLRWQLLRKPWQQAIGSEQDELESQAIHRCIFDDKGQVVAVGRLHIDEGFIGHIRYMAVADSEQGKGLGKAIILALEQEAQLRKAHILKLNAREQAVSFYQSFNYTIIDKAHLLYGQIPHFSMEKSLASAEFSEPELINKLQSTWHNTIALSKAMNINICAYDTQNLLTTCDPQFNKNLHNTMFAGSIYTLATLTGWGWVYLQLEQAALKGDIVLADANIRYLAPIAGVAHGRVSASEVKGETNQLQQKTRAKFHIKVEILTGDKVAAEFNGKYVVMGKN